MRGIALNESLRMNVCAALFVTSRVVAACYAVHSLPEGEPGASDALQP